MCADKWVTSVGNQYKEETDDQIFLEEGNETTKNNQNNILELNSLNTEKLPEMREYSGKTTTIKITAGAILGSLSIIIGFSWDAIVERIGGFGPSFAFGMTWIDFLAIPIIVAFLVFGALSGIIAAIIGCGAIAFYLSEAFGWLAMWPKFFASTSMFVIPWLILKIINRKNHESKSPFLRSLKMSSESLQPIKNYSFVMGIAIFGRATIMFVINTLVIAPLFLWLYSGREQFTTVFTDPIFYLTLGGGYFAWNLVQGIADAIISYLIVYPTKLYKHYSIW